MYLKVLSCLFLTKVFVTNILNLTMWKTVFFLLITFPLLTSLLDLILIIGCMEGSIRLAEGNSISEGRVEICFNNEYGAVCGNGWDSRDAQVVCRQLGFQTLGNADYTYVIYRLVRMRFYRYYLKFGV